MLEEGNDAKDNILTRNCGRGISFSDLHFPSMGTLQGSWSQVGQAQSYLNPRGWELRVSESRLK